MQIELNGLATEILMIIDEAFGGRFAHFRSMTPDSNGAPRLLNLRME